MAYPVDQPDPTKVVGRRVLAIILDAFLVIVPAVLLVTSQFEYLDVDDLDQSAEAFCDDFQDQEDNGICLNFEDMDDRVYFSDDSNLTSTGIYWGSNFLFLVVLQGLTGWTPGKLITGIRVVRGDTGDKPGVLKALVRWLLWIADGFPYVIPGLTGFFIALSTAGHRRVGDIGAGTFVVKRSATGQPIRVEDGGRLVVGTEAPTAAPPSWGAPPPSAPDAPTGWGTPVDPERSAPIASAASPAPTPGVEGPQWDETRGTYIQWDPGQGAWMQWDEGFKSWIRIPGQ